MVGGLQADAGKDGVWPGLFVQNRDSEALLRWE